MTWTTPRTWVDGEVPSASVMNTHVRDNINYQYGNDTAWTNVADASMSNGWVNYDTAGWQVRYRRVAAFTRVEGLVKNGTLNTVVFTLPAGFRPNKNLIFGTGDAAAGTGYAELRIGSDGTVRAQSFTSNVWFSLHSMFLAEQ